MFTAKHLNALLHERPFKPFRICMTDGKSFDVIHPETVFVTTAHIIVAVKFNADNIPDDVVRCAVLHIARIEDISVPQAA